MENILDTTSSLLEVNMEPLVQSQEKFNSSSRYEQMF